MDNHAQAVASAVADISAPWAGTWFIWGGYIAQALQILALILTVAFTVMRMYKLGLDLKGK